MYPKVLSTHFILTAMIMTSLLQSYEGATSSCPSVCACKWKGGKQTVECVNRALITIPEYVDPETQVLDMRGNNLQILPRETFIRAGLLNLQKVYLQNCQLGQIDDQAFRGLANLVELDLSFNLLTAVPSATFQDIPFLRDLTLANNPIQKIDSHSFRTVPGLVKLDLSHCELQSIAPKAFEGVELLESLKLNGNRLTELRPRTVETLSRLHGVELHDNPWVCDCRLRQAKLWLTDNNIPYPLAPVCAGGPERVLHKTFAELHVDDFACKPSILPVSRYVEAATGENATVVCRAGAVPPASVNWYWNGRLLQNNTAFSSYQKIFIFEEGHFEKRSKLVLTNAQETDSSEFYCVAENRAGNAEANFTLHVSMRTAGMATLGNSQIVGLSAALVILICFILLFIFVLLVRLRRIPTTETKTPGQLEVVTVVNRNGAASVKPATTPIETSSFAERKPSDPNAACNPVQKPPRLTELPYSTTNYNGNGSVINPSSCIVSPSSASGNNPDLINDTKRLEGEDVPVAGVAETGVPAPIPVDDRPNSGEYRNVCESLYPSGLWEHAQSGNSVRCSTGGASYSYDDKTPIIGEGMGLAEDVGEYMSNTNVYPSDYGLPVPEDVVPPPVPPPPASAKAMRVWQRGGVPVLPPVTALKRALTSSRNSPDEGYQEGYGTDV